MIYDTAVRIFFYFIRPNGVTQNIILPIFKHLLKFTEIKKALRTVFLFNKLVCDDF